MTFLFDTSLEVDGAALSFYWTLPFIGFLMSLACMPIIIPDLWHRHYGKISLFWTFLSLISLTVTFGTAVSFYTIFHTLLCHFAPFIIFIFTFYVICGGIKIDLRCRATPLFNTLYLAFGTFTANWIGTTGAAMLFIRPLLSINKHRPHQSHLVIFFIFLICNIGGCLTPLGDPPLFLGFLYGIDFFWPITHLTGPFLTIVIPLLTIAYLLDRHYFRQKPLVSDQVPLELKLKIHGIKNGVLLGFSVAVIALSGIWRSNIELSFFEIKLPLDSLVRDALLIFLALLSFRLTPPSIRASNSFTWAPLREITFIFLAIFMTAIPVFAMLKAGQNGAFSGLISLLENDAGSRNIVYFWFTGILSAFLDNAPAYLMFFNLAGGEASTLMTTSAQTLIAISLGAVFMGALTYIGNTPNFVVKAIAEEKGIKMPSFFGYLAWSTAILVPLLAVVGWLWI